MGVLGGYFAGHDKNDAGDDDHADDELNNAHATTSFAGEWLTACRLRHQMKF